VPIDIQKYVGKKELRYSLRTGYLGVAKQKARCLAGQVQSVFRMLKNGDLMINLSEEKIQELVNNYIKQRLEQINNLFNEGPGDDILPFGTITEFYSYISLLDTFRQELAANLNMGNWEMLEDEIIRFLQSQGMKDIDKSSVEYQRLCSGIHQSEIKLLPIEKRHRLNDFSYKEELPDIFPEVFDKKEPEPTPMPPEESSEPLEKVVQDYWNEKVQTWKERTKPEIRRSLDHMIDFLGRDVQIHKIGAKAIRDYKEHLLTEKIRSGKTRSIKTINDKYLCFTKAFFSFAKSNQYIKENPAEGMFIKDRKKKRPHEHQDPFSPDDLRMLFCDSHEYL
jgi:hypothetical protein